MNEMREVRLPAELCAAAEKKFAAQFKSLEELLQFVLHDLLRDEASFTRRGASFTIVSDSRCTSKKRSVFDRRNATVGCHRFIHYAQHARQRGYAERRGKEGRLEPGAGPGRSEGSCAAQGLPALSALAPYAGHLCG